MTDILKKYNFDEKQFEKLKTDFISGKFTEQDNIIKGRVEPPLPDSFIDLRKKGTEEVQKLGTEVIKTGALGCVIINGGMATRFGGVVKGIIDVYDNKSFLQIKLEQIKRTSQKYGIKIPIFLMNSFATSAPTIEYLEKNKYFGLRPDEIHIFDQFIFKRLNPDGSEFEPGNKNTPSRPCTQERDTPFEKRGINTPDCNEKYYGPGHGDFPYAFRQSGLLDAFLKNSGKYVWFSNVDNLGATINEIILGAHIKSGAEMTAELAEKYPGDKGGAPALVNGKLQIVEQFKFPVSFNQNLINVFNSATYIFTAEALKRDFNLPYYVVKKEVAGKKVIQFERLAGDLSIYLKANYVIVEREKRFIPIKTQEDLSRHREFFKKKFG